MGEYRGASSAFEADLVFLGGEVLVLDPAGSRASALAVSGGRITAVGSDAEIARRIGSGTRVVRLEGRALLPGINDSHLHATWLGARWPRTFFGGEDSGGDPAEEPALASREERRAAILRAGRILSEYGITSYTEPGIGPGEDAGATGCFASEVLDVYRELAEAGELLQRVTLLGLYGVLDGPSSRDTVIAGIAELASAQGDSDPAWLRIAGVKLFGDLIPLSRGAWTALSYDDGSHGGLLVEGDTEEARAESLGDMVRAGHRAGIQVAVHATGDLTIAAVIAAIEEAAAEPGALAPAELGHCIIHGDLATTDQLARMAELGMWFNSQPGIAAATGDWLQAALPDARPWQYGAALAAGTLVLSSDAPILAPDWRQGIADAEARIVAHGAADSPEARGARLGQLLRAYTAVAAAQDRAAEWKGTLEVGKVADLVVLGADPFAVGAARLPGVSIDLTVIAGAVVFERSVDSGR